MNNFAQISQPWFIYHDDVNGKDFRVTSPVWTEFSGHRWIPVTRASDARFCFIFFDVQAVKQVDDLSMIWDFIVLMWYF